MTKTKSKSLMTSVMTYGRAYILPVVLALVMAALGSIATIVGPGQISKITNLIAEGLRSQIDLTTIVRIVVGLAVIYGLGALLSYGQGYTMATVTQKFTQKLRTEISQKINRLPLSYFDEHNEGDTLSRVTNDLDTLAQSLNQSLGNLIASVTLLVGVIIMMLTTNVVMTLTAVGAIIIGFILTMVIIGKSQGFFNAQQNQLGQLSSYVEETYAGHAVIKTTNETPHAKQQFSELNHGLYQVAWKSQFLSGTMQPLMTFIGNLGYVLVAVIGSVLAVKGQVTMGTIVAFMMYVRIFTQPLSQIAQAFSSLQTAQAAMQRVFGFLDEPEMTADPVKPEALTAVQGRVEFNHVHFGYQTDNPVIKDFSAQAQPGQKIAIVGPTGAGKTTLVNLLMRFYDTNSGTIKIDGVDTQLLTRAQVHAQFDMVLQDTWLFNDTIKNNLVYNQPHVSDDQVKQAAEAVGISHFIESLPKGYDTVLDDTVSLSAGQKQLLTIARALIRNAPMLILDEATSSVDTRTEEQLQNAMDRLTQGRTSFVIAHRLSTIKNADLILVVNNGNIIEQGTHDQLMAKHGFYATLYNSQFQSAGVA